MRIVIDMQAVQGENGNRGIGRYALALVKAMLRAGSGHQFLMVLNGMLSDSIDRIKRELDGLLLEDSYRIWYCPVPVYECVDGNSLRTGVAELIREKFIASLSPDIVYILSFFEGFGANTAVSIDKSRFSAPVAITLYDLIPYLKPAMYLEQNPLFKKHYLNKFRQLRNADMLLCDSASTAKEGVENIPFDAEFTVNVSGACDESFKILEMNDDEVKQLQVKFNFSNKFIMYTGGLDPRKNIEGLIDAYSKLPKDLIDQYQLLIVCSMNDESKSVLMDLVQRKGLEDNRVVLTGFVTDQELVQLYNLCYLFVFPSFHEGFGLPALEAMACGAPVIGSNCTSIPEVIGMEEALFDPYDSDALIKAIKKALTDSNFRNRLIENGRERVKIFSWEKSARRALAGLEKTVEAFSKRSSAPEKKKRLAYVSPVLPEESGISVYSSELLAYLSEHYIIDIISDTGNITDPFVRKHLEVQSVTWFRDHYKEYDRVVYQFGNSDFHSHMFSLLEQIPGTVVLHDFFLSGVVHHMQIHGGMHGLWSKFLYRSHGYLPFLLHPDVNNAIDLIWNYPVNLPVLQNALSIIVHSEYSKKLAEQTYGIDTSEKWIKIPHLRIIKKKQSRKSARKKCGLRADDFVVCSFGFLGENKHILRLLQGWMAAGLHAHTNVKLVFVGQNHADSYGDRVVDFITFHGLQDNVTITGFVSGDDYKNYLDAADAAVQLRTLSRGETSGAVLDVLAGGIPLLVNANGAMAEYPDDTVLKISDDFSDGELSAALRRLFEDEDLRRELSEKSVDYIREMHDPKRCASLYCSAIESGGLGAGCLQLADEIIDRFSPLNESDLIQTAGAIAETFPVGPAQKQLFVDVSELCQRDMKSGIQRVTRSILMELLMNPPPGYRVEPVYATADKPGYRYARSFVFRFIGSPIPPVLPDELLEFRQGDIFLGLDLQPVIVPAQVEFLQKMHRHGVKIHFVLYDLLLIQMPQHFYPGGDQLLLSWLDTVAKFDGAMCISKAVADDYAQFYANRYPDQVDGFHIGWFHLGADVENSVPTAGIPESGNKLLEKLKNETVFLMVGTIEPRKAHDLILKSCEILWRDGVDFNLVFIGKQGWMVESLVARMKNHPESGKRFHWLEGISDEYLEQVYNAADCLVAASEGEGFGLPIIEAYRNGLAVLARDIPVFREVAGEGAFFFRGTAPETVAEELKSWLTLFQQGEIPVPEAVQLLTWSESTTCLLDGLGINSSEIN